MSFVQNDNRAHQAALLAAEVAYQSGVAALGSSATQAQLDALDIVRLRASIASALANKCSTEVFVTALKGNHNLNV